ncbi:chlorohydrolase [Streptococcus pneumoniae]|nr:chlorohydrolase [Streptococcus pneumoniae]
MNRFEVADRTDEKYSFEVVDKTDEVSSKHCLSQLMDRTDEVSPKHGFR